jgi:hypothetical protein
VDGIRNVYRQIRVSAACGMERGYQGVFKHGEVGVGVVRASQVLKWGVPGSWVGFEMFTGNAFPQYVGWLERGEG